MMIWMWAGRGILWIIYVYITSCEQLDGFVIVIDIRKERIACSNVIRL